MAEDMAEGKKAARRGKSSGANDKKQSVASSKGKPAAQAASASSPVSMEGAASAPTPATQETRVFKLAPPLDPNGRVSLFDRPDLVPLLIPEDAPAGTGKSLFDVLGSIADVESVTIELTLDKDANGRLVQLLAIRAFLNAVRRDDLRITRRCSVGRNCDQ